MVAGGQRYTSAGLRLGKRSVPNVSKAGGGGTVDLGMYGKTSIPGHSSP
jgi:hypothetical protein